MDWLLSLTSCVMLWLMGSGSKWGPVVGIANQALWYAYAVRLREWGLLPGITAFTIIHARNAWRWWREQEGR